MQSFSFESATTTQNAKLSKPQVLAINRVKWVMIYSIVILLTESCFFFFLCYSTLAVNTLLLINNIYSLYYTYKTLNSKVYLSDEYNKAVEISKALFSGDIKKIPSNQIGKIFAKVDHIDIKEEQNIIDFLANNKICSSKREAREFVNAGSITLNGDKVTDLETVVSKDLAIDNKYVVVRKGKKKYFLGEFIGE